MKPAPQSLNNNSQTLINEIDSKGKTKKRDKKKSKSKENDVEEFGRHNKDSDSVHKPKSKKKSKSNTNTSNTNLLDISPEGVTSFAKTSMDDSNTTVEKRKKEKSHKSKDTGKGTVIVKKEKKAKHHRSHSKEKKAEPHECSDERETYRNSYRDRQYNTRLGTLDLRIPKLREGLYFPSFLEACRLSEKALNAVIQEA